jgi:hypothetical protein
MSVTGIFHQLTFRNAANFLTLIDLRQFYP